MEISFSCGLISFPCNLFHKNWIDDIAVVEILVSTVTAYSCVLFTIITFLVGRSFTGC